MWYNDIVIVLYISHQLVVPLLLLGMFRAKVAFLNVGLNFLTQLQCAIPSRQENSSKLLTIEMENYPIIMTMGMY